MFFVKKVLTCKDTKKFWFSKIKYWCSEGFSVNLKVNFIELFMALGIQLVLLKHHLHVDMHIDQFLLAP